MENLMPFNDAAQAAFRSGETDMVTDLAQAELRRSTAAGDPQGQVESRYYLSRVALRQGDLVDAEHLPNRHLRWRSRPAPAALRNAPGTSSRPLPG